MSTRTNRNPMAPTVHVVLSSLSIRSDALPAGVCGIVTGVALVYSVVDSWRTRFLPGALDKTRNKVAAGKVKLFDNHGATDGYGTRTHVGTVRALELVGAQELMRAEILDTEDGRRCHEYLSAVLASKAETGLSIGFYVREEEWNDTLECWDITEIELEEISLAPRNAVPGADVLSVRRKPGSVPVDAARGLLTGLRATMGADAFAALLDEFTEDAGDDPAAGKPGTEGNGTPADDATRTDATPPEYATMDQRLAAVRQSFAFTE